MNMRGRFSRDPRTPQVRVNHRIRVPEVRVVLEDGENLGVITTEEALRIAHQRGQDLVEVNPKANPPVCKILDFGKYKYEEKKKAAEARRKQTIVEVKEVKLRPKTDDHDIAVKIRHARKFLESGNKVKLTCRFRGREITHPQIAQQQLDLLIRGVEDLATVEQRAAMEGKTMSVLIAPKPQVLQRLAAERTARERDRERRGLSSPENEAPEEPELDEDEDDDDDDEAGEG